MELLFKQFIREYYILFCKSFLIKDNGENKSPIIFIYG